MLRSYSMKLLPVAVHLASLMPERLEVIMLEEVHGMLQTNPNLTCCDGIEEQNSHAMMA